MQWRVSIIPKEGEVSRRPSGEFHLMSQADKAREEGWISRPEAWFAQVNKGKEVVLGPAQDRSVNVPGTLRG